jgi:ABC-type cobalamin transport system ATPase subunit
VIPHQSSEADPNTSCKGDLLLHLQADKAPLNVDSASNADMVQLQHSTATLGAGSALSSHTLARTHKGTDGHETMKRGEPDAASSTMQILRMQNLFTAAACR